MLGTNAYQLSKTVSNNLIRQCELLGKKLPLILLLMYMCLFKWTWWTMWTCVIIYMILNN